MKRLSFLSATGAAAIAGCAGHHTLPGLATTSASQHPPSARGLRLVPSVPDPIPASVLAHPIAGEAYRFAGTTPPSGWLFLQGQKLPISQYPQLFSVLGHPQGDKSTTTFTLPNLSYGVVIAATGVIPSSHQAFARMRDLSAQRSLGPGARPAPVKAPKPPPAQVLESRRLMASAIRPKSGSPVMVTSELSDAIESARSRAYLDAKNAIDAQTVGVLDAAVAGAVDGRISVYDAVIEVTAQISRAEANAVLAINDRMRQSFANTNVAGAHANPQREAAQFLVSSAITPEQAAAIAQRE